MVGRAIVVAIGDELLSGETVDTNSSFLDRCLERWGGRVLRHVTVPDDEAAIAAAFRESAADADVVLSTGGLGPTQDDVTLGAFAAALDSELAIDEPARASLEARFAKRGWPVGPNQLRQVTVPVKGRVLLNGVGLAPAVAAELDGATIVVMPGVPSEVRWLMDHRVRDVLGARPPQVQRRLLKTVGIGESRLETTLETVIRDHAAVRFGFRALGAENHVKLAAFGATATAELDAAEAAARAVLGPAVFGGEDDDLSVVVGAALKAAGQTVATAESCTGGLIAKRLTDVPGSSAYVVGGVVAYANEVKTALLDVDPAVIEAHGAVSEPVARQMAEGVRRRLGTDWGLSATGVAGPGGGTADKPVGLVWIGLAGPNGVEARAIHRPGNRLNVRDGTARILLHWLLAEVKTSTS